MVATDEAMTAKENVALVKIIEDNNIKVARERKYKAVFTTNTSETTRVRIVYELSYLQCSFIKFVTLQVESCSYERYQLNCLVTS